MEFFEFDLIVLVASISFWSSFVLKCICNFECVEAVKMYKTRPGGKFD